MTHSTHTLHALFISYLLRHLLFSTIKQWSGSNAISIFIVVSLVLSSLNSFWKSVSCFLSRMTGDHSSFYVLTIVCICGLIFLFCVFLTTKRRNKFDHSTRLSGATDGQIIDFSVRRHEKQLHHVGPIEEKMAREPGNFMVFAMQFSFAWTCIWYRIWQYANDLKIFPINIKFCALILELMLML